MKKLCKKLAVKIILKILLRKGFPYHTAIVAVKELAEDIIQVKGIGLLKKISLYKKGYYSQRLACYGIGENNPLNNYIPELKYYKLHPINGIYSKWIDDKLTMRYIFNGYSEYLPKYYYQILHRQIIKLTDCAESYSPDIIGILCLLHDKKILAAKPAAGSRGYGFHKIEYIDSKYLIDGIETSEHALSELFLGMDDYLFTEFIQPYEELRNIYPSVVNPVRVVVTNDGTGPRIAASFIRFKVTKPQFASNLSSYGLYCGINLDTGEMFDPIKYNYRMEVIKAPVHPDTGLAVKGKIKNWDIMKRILNKMGVEFPQLRLIGYDIVFTEESFRIIEMNSIPGIQHTQYYYPLFKNPLDREFFKKQFEEKKIKI